MNITFLISAIVCIIIAILLAKWGRSLSYEDIVYAVCAGIIAIIFVFIGIILFVWSMKLDTPEKDLEFPATEYKLKTKIVTTDNQVDTIYVIEAYEN